MDDRQLIADLLSALEYHTEQTRPIEFSKVAIEAAREYLRKPAQQGPVAWGVFEGNLHDMFFTEAEAVEMAQLKGNHAEVKPLYTATQRTWVGLTHEEHMEIMTGTMTTSSRMAAVEAKLREKNL